MQSAKQNALSRPEKSSENPSIRRQRHGISHFQLCLKCSPKQERVMIQREVQSLEDEGRRAKGNEHGAQGASTKWGPLRRNITWAKLWRLEPFLISFLLRAVYAQVGGGLCADRGTILSACKIVLAQGRYRWQHDRVLTTRADIPVQQRIKKHPVKI